MIRLRKRVRKNKTHLYLDCYYNGTRKVEGLNLYLTKDKQSNKEIIRFAEGIQSEIKTNLCNISINSRSKFVYNFKVIKAFQYPSCTNLCEGCK